MPQTLCTVYGNTTDTLYGLWQHHRHTVRSMATPQTHCTAYGNTTNTLYGLWTTPQTHQERSQWVQRARGKPRYSKIMAVHKTSTSPSSGIRLYHSFLFSLSLLFLLLPFSSHVPLQAVALWHSVCVSGGGRGGGGAKG